MAGVADGCVSRSARCPKTASSVRWQDPVEKKKGLGRFPNRYNSDCLLPK
jgi:hypothetical protein